MGESRSCSQRDESCKEILKDYVMTFLGRSSYAVLSALHAWGACVVTAHSVVVHALLVDAVKALGDGWRAGTGSAVVGDWMGNPQMVLHGLHACLI
jgi:hypothetical protein